MRNAECGVRSAHGRRPETGGCNLQLETCNLKPNRSLRTGGLVSRRRRSGGVYGRRQAAGDDAERVLFRLESFE
jgi:hypothetical protein